MDIDWAKEFAVLFSGAPHIAFGLIPSASIVLITVIWLLNNRRYKGQIDTLNAQIALRGCESCNDLVRVL